jgi:hypothetical protein
MLAHRILQFCLTQYLAFLLFVSSNVLEVSDVLAVEKDYYISCIFSFDQYFHHRFKKLNHSTHLQLELGVQKYENEYRLISMGQIICLLNNVGK